MDFLFYKAPILLGFGIFALLDNTQKRIARVTDHSTTKDPCFTTFKTSISEYTLPERFTFPFYYQPHPIAVRAAEELQQHIETQTDWNHDFGLIVERENVIIGKMFGVLVVETADKQIGYLSAFSGKLAGSNHHSRFVPPVFDMLTEGSYLNEGMAFLNEINTKVKELEAHPDFIAISEKFEKEKAAAKDAIAELRAEMRMAKARRKEKRNIEKERMEAEQFALLEAKLSKESIGKKIELKQLNEYWESRLATIREQVERFTNEIDELKEKRKNKSNFLQNKLFKEYQFLNKDGELKSLLDIFAGSIPTGGSGECAAPKLLQYAFSHQMKPIALAEFWWGQSPKSEIRKHRHYYPACQGKCKPILAHMLKGIPMDANPLLENTALGKKLTIVYEDDYLLVINKPAEFLSVPGRHVKDCVANRMKEKYPEATGPLIVHRLDMSTSGLMLIAKSLEIHKPLQVQFVNRTVKKRYVALLDGLLEPDEGLIDLPLRVDLDDRPRQLVCYEHGKSAQTRYRVIERKKNQTRVHFFPVTGRTHQLRMHAAHAKGLNMAIVGDDLYGKAAERLCLHAEKIGFEHPIQKKWMSFCVAADF